MADEALEMRAYRARRYDQLMNSLYDAADDGESVFATLRREIRSPHTTSSTIPVLLDLGQYFHVMRTYTRRLKALAQQTLNLWKTMLRRHVKTSRSLMAGLQRYEPTGE